MININQKNISFPKTAMRASRFASPVSGDSNSKFNLVLRQGIISI